MHESRLWTLVGGACFGAGVMGIAIPTFARGLRPGDNLTLSVFLASAFICIAGAAGFTAGRTMQALQTGTAAKESALLRGFGVVQIPAGVAIVIAAAVRSRQWTWPTANHIWLGALGASVLLIGIYDLLAYRVLSKVASTPKAQAASA
jgi:drug/metabolite transporter (DMT)-like permease